jgi:8-oxo-dGTP pyrophosphatase MutT (NUDIX family)
MASNNSWKKISSTNLFKHPRLTVSEDEVLLPNGEKTSYLLYSEGSDYITIIAKNNDDRYALISEYSYPLDGDMLQFPEGKCDKNELPEVSAKREFAEETGYNAKNTKILGSLPKSHRRDTIIQIVVLATDLYESDEVHHRDAEEIGLDLQWVTKDEINQLIAQGLLVQRNTLAAWALYTALGY